VAFYTVCVRTTKGDRWVGYFNLKRLPTQLEIHEALADDKFQYVGDLKAAGADDRVVQAKQRTWWRLTDLVEYATPELSLGRTVVYSLRRKKLGSITIRRLRMSCPVATPLTWDDEPASLPTLPGSSPKVPPGSLPPHMMN
jgi:hypothetical protein